MFLFSLDMFPELDHMVFIHLIILRILHIVSLLAVPVYSTTTVHWGSLYPTSLPAFVIACHSDNIHPNRHAHLSS